METIFVFTGRSSGEWRDRFEAAAPEFRWLCWPDIDGAADASVMVGWNPPPDLFRQLPGLRLVHALGAGVDGFLKREDLPDVPLVRLLDAGMAEQMVEYALLGALLWQRRLPLYREQQAEAKWWQWPARERGEVRVGVLGLGQMGGTVARGLAGFGYAVAGWSRSARQIEGIDCLHGDGGLDTLLGRSDVLVSMLPSTPDTRDLLDHARLSRLPEGALVVNAARGDQLVAEELIALLDSGHLSSALLDVFASEPLPKDSPLWSHPKVMITPHVAALTVPGPSVKQVVANLRRWKAGDPLQGVVDRARGY
ncbi:2-hydroxyacid dehydrogenase [Pseudomarimonas salicorniae]|uniref:Glyoxylate/hydroxypyruvate reductase A n=1 Tax=Pseudomarimonas salicorniae TaxID=2933270 RepID=A0ABT0GG61_9GAMM|nr:glyoxylate/hydroxypyruvate reductase A [Lysobacter sp. CAU 1642]MCK7593528.1 glyoxylate/hydroxypyruvate reductase A [Lysobacter sp. CAU 1642]